MSTLIVVGIVSGLITAISPCVLPVLPAILTSSIQDGARSRRRPLVVVGGLVTSFAVFTILGGILLSSLGLPDDLLRWAGIVTLSIVGVGLAIPAVGHLLERPFQNTKLPQLNRGGNGFVMGLALGLVFVPCAGPILASITVLAATNLTRSRAGRTRPRPRVASSRSTSASSSRRTAFPIAAPHANLLALRRGSTPMAARPSVLISCADRSC